MQDLASRLRGIHLLGSRVNKGPESHRPRSFQYVFPAGESVATLAPPINGLAHPVVELLIRAAPANAL
jgi:hypothetical protein